MKCPLCGHELFNTVFPSNGYYVTTDHSVINYQYSTNTLLWVIIENLIESNKNSLRYS